MAAHYYTSEVVENVNVPAVSVTWPGLDGCGSSTRTRGVRSYSISPGTLETYEPVIEHSFRAARTISGRNGRGSAVPYHMTPHFVRRTVERRYLTRRANGANGCNCFTQYGEVRKVGGTCTPTPLNVVSTGPLYPKSFDVGEGGSSTMYVLHGFGPTDVSDAVADVEDAVSVKALSSYDFLTEIAEAREIPNLVASISRTLIGILGSLRGGFTPSVLRDAARISPLDLLKHPYKMMRKFGEQWMQYRYGIMPLVYSYRDAMKTLHRGMSVKDHCTRVIAPTSLGVSLPASTVDYRWTEIVGDIRVRGTVFQHFDLEAVSRLSGISFNPLITAWELIPYSFVVDWFVNVGDYIIRRTSQSAAQTTYACISLRSHYSTRKWHHFVKEDKTISFSNQLTSPWTGAVPPATPSVTISRPEESQIYSSSEVDEYSRWSFPVTGARLRINTSLNWRRLVDSAAMVLNLLGGLMSRLR